MGRVLRIYFHILFGALGGLLGWMLFGELVRKEWDWWQAALVGGGLIGAMIGYGVVGVDAILDRTLTRFCRYAVYGVFLGGLGGAAGFWLGDWVNYVLVPSSEHMVGVSGAAGSVAARGLGWMIFGLLVGASGGFAARSWNKFWYGTLGGSLGGLIGGSTFGLFMEGLAKGTASYTWGQALGLVVLGAAIGGLIAVVEEVLRPAALRVLRGWQEGREYPLVKASSMLGRDEAADILLLRDVRIEKQHAIIERNGRRYLLINNRAPADNTLINGKPLNQACELHDGDRIQLGNVLLKFTTRTG